MGGTQGSKLKLKWTRLKYWRLYTSRESKRKKKKKKKRRRKKEKQNHDGKAINSKITVEIIAGERRAGVEYLVKWNGYADLEWVPNENLSGARRILQKFEEEFINHSTEDDEMLLTEDAHNSKTADLTESLHESEFDTLNKCHVELKRKYAELKQKI